MLRLDRQVAWPTGIGLTLRGVLDWWVGELLALVPSSVRRAVVPRRARLQVVADANGLTLVREDGGARHLIGHVPTNPVTVAGSAANSKTKSAADAVIRVTADRALRTIANLPLAAQANLDQVVAFEFERLVPFRRSESYFAYRVIERNKLARNLRVELTVVPRAEIDALMRLAEKSGFRVAAVEVAGASPADSAIGLPISSDGDAGLQSGASVVIGALSGLALVLAVICVAVPFVQMQHKLDALTVKVAEARRRANTRLELRKRIEAQLATETALIRRRNRTPTISELLDEVTRLIPDDTWLTELRISGNEIQLVGLSPSASNLLRLVARSPRFRDAAFVSPVTRDARLDREQFTISAHIRPRGER